MNILIVDDSKTMRMMIARTLKKAGFDGHSISQAGNGVEALKVIEDANPDVVLCDWNMPEMNGIELLRKLREDGNRVKFGFVTTETTNDVREMADELGVSFFITKPFTPEKFDAELSPILV